MVSTILPTKIYRGRIGVSELMPLGRFCDALEMRQIEVWSVHKNDDGLIVEFRTVVSNFVELRQMIGEAKNDCFHKF